MDRSCVLMNTPKRSVCLITVFLFPLTIASIDSCLTSYCRVSAPFRTPDQPASCGLPGFDLSCDFPYTTRLLSFPSSNRNFSVDSIYYYTKEITVSDPEGCLQKKLLGFDPSGTPFRFRDPAHFPLYNCSRSKLPYYFRSYEIGCLSGSNYSVLWDNSSTRTLFTYYGCEFVGDALGPRDWTYYTFAFSRAKSVDMNWELPASCQLCGNGGCRRDPYDPRRVTCSSSSPPTSNSSKDAAHIVLPTIAALILLVLVCLCICCRARRSALRAAQGDGASTAILTNNVNSHLNTSRQSSVLPLGLEQATLDAYPIMVVGGSGRILVNMEDKTCPICLCEYEPKETLKTLPECLHRFHAECIDEWLRAKALCPVCRTPPPRRSS